MLDYAPWLALHFKEAKDGYCLQGPFSSEAVLLAVCILLFK
jgi:hypothetical protein